jgi:hypothetical protein
VIEVHLNNRIDDEKIIYMVSLDGSVEKESD